MINRKIQIAMAMLIGMPGLATAAGTVRLPATGQTICYNANGGAIACAGTGQDGDTRANGVAWPTPRFTANGIGAMTDNLTGLIWSKHANAPEFALGLNFCKPATPGPEIDMTWPQSIDYISCLNGLNGVGYLGFNDWRLPNVIELESLVNAEVADTAASFLTPSGFTQPQPSQYWTSTTDASNLPVSPFATLNAWDMDLAKGQSFSTDKTAAIGTKAVWPVRGVSTGPAKIWRTGQDTCFDLGGDPIPCGGTGQDGEKLAGSSWPAIRFKTSPGNTFVLDRVTGLIWTQNTNTPGPLGGACAGTGLPAGLSWLDALTHAKCLNTNSFLGLQPDPVVGNTGWRIPNRKELRSLVDYSRGGAALPTAHPFTGFVELLRWSSTTNVSTPNQAWSVNLVDGDLSGSSKVGTLPAWPVSGPDLAPPALAVSPVTTPTNVVSQIISGTVETGSAVTVAVNGGAPAAATVTGNTWSFTINTLTQGANVVTVTAADFSENLTTAPVTITLDIVPPAIAINPVATPTNVVGQTISGTVEAGATLAVALGTTPLPVTVDGTTWSSVITTLGAGANGITVTATDALGNTATLPPITIILDTTIPASSASPAAGVYAEAVSVALTMNEPGVIFFTIDGSTPTASSAVYSAPITFTSPSTKTLKFFSIDQAGNNEAVQSLTYTVHAPDLTGTVAINNGAPVTNSTLVTLALFASDPAGVPEMQVACNGITFAPAEPYAVTRSCTLSSGDGLKTVLVKFKDGLGNWYPPLNAQITLDTAAPSTTATPLPGTYSGTVTVTLLANEAGTIYYTTTGALPTTSSPVYAGPFELAASATTVYNVRFFAVDRGGNSEQVKSAVFTVHVSDLTGSIAINDGAPYAVSTAVALALSAQDPAGVDRMQFSNDGSNFTPLEPYATSKTWTLTGGDGLKTVFIRFEDGTGTLYTFSANIILSTTAASVSSCDLNGDSTVDIRDALKALQMAIGLYSPTMDEVIRGDVAPLVNGKPRPDGAINLADSLLILQRSLGLVAAW